MKRIGLYFDTTITIIKVTLALGNRSVSSIENVPAAMFRRDVFHKTLMGGFYESKDFIGLKHDANITGEDEVTVNGIKRTISNITKVRESRYSSGISHLEVELG